MSTFVTHLESALDGTRLPAGTIQTVHRDRPLWVRYDLEQVGRAVSKDELETRPPTMWRYRELLPTGDDVVSLGEGMTPLLPCPRLGERFGLSDLWIKDESLLPTGSFKSRGLAVAVNMARQFGIKRLAIPTAGNAGAAMAAYAARAGMEAFVFMPNDTPAVNRYECLLYGAKTFLVDGLITDCARIVREGRDVMNWFDFSTLREPYRIEGKKTMGLELAEQCGWKLPDVILYPTGGGTGLIGMSKAFDELAALGWLESDTRPRMVSVQSDGCCPIVRAYDKGERFAEPWQNARTIATGLRVPAAVGDFMILDAVRASGGRAVAVREERIPEWMNLAASCEGIPVCPEAAVCIGALERLVSEGWIAPDERVVIFNTGAAQKYVEAITTDIPLLAKDAPVDWDSLAGGKSD
ncbi:MAG TPA: threonine synthase [Acidobacteriota bacterium]|nr:threonine synthase [Acidobacteriota bacterium]